MSRRKASVEVLNLFCWEYLLPEELGWSLLLHAGQPFWSIWSRDMDVDILVAMKLIATYFMQL